MAQILTSILIWSSLGILVKISGLPPGHLIFFSSSVSSLCILVMMLCREGLRESFPRPRALVPMLFLGPLSLLNTFSFFYAYQNTSIANAVLTHYIAPVLVAFLAPVTIGERLTVRILLSVAMASAGLWIMLDMSFSHLVQLLLSGDSNTVGILAGLLSGVCYAILIILVRIYAQNYHPMVITFSQNLLIALILFPFSSTTHVPSHTYLLILVLGVIHSTIAPALYFSGMKRVSANKAAILGYLEPVAAIGLGAIFLHESIGIETIVGGSMILFSGALTIKSPRDAEERTLE